MMLESWLLIFWVSLLCMAKWYPCVCPDCCECDYCDACPPNTITMTLSGWQADFCDCAVFNDTFILYQGNWTECCIWRYVDINGPHCFGDDGMTVYLDAEISNSGWEAYAHFYDGPIICSEATYLWASGGGEIDCTDTQTLTYSSQYSCMLPACFEMEYTGCQIN